MPSSLSTFPSTFPSPSLSPPQPRILSLPTELVLAITEHLPVDALLATKLTHPLLNAAVPFPIRLDHPPLSKCAELAIRDYLCPEQHPSHLRCMLCKNVYPLALFNSSASPACIPAPKDVVELPERLCAWHVGRLTKKVYTGPSGRNEWASDVRDMCMHCGALKGWSDCRCACVSCGSRSVRTYTRFLNNQTECRTFRFFREYAEDAHDETGQLFVEEHGWDPDATSSSSVSRLPVHITLEPPADLERISTS